jgi:hypothetical protein
MGGRQPLPNHVTSELPVIPRVFANRVRRNGQFYEKLALRPLPKEGARNGFVAVWNCFSLSAFAFRETA